MDLTREDFKETSIDTNKVEEPQILASHYKIIDIVKLITRGIYLLTNFK